MGILERVWSASCSVQVLLKDVDDEEDGKGHMRRLMFHANGTESEKPKKDLCRMAFLFSDPHFELQTVLDD